jgi:hypothetical protein
MGRRLGIGTSAFVLAVSVVMGAGWATPASAVVSVQATGHVHCSAVGKVAYGKPHLTLLSLPGVVAKFKASLTCSIGQTGHAGVTVVSGKLKGQSSAYTASCAAANPTSLAATIKWKATGGKVSPTTITWGAATGGTSPYTHAFSGGTVTGSYAGELPVASFVADTVNQASCGLKGIKSWTFGMTATSTLDVNTPPPCGPIGTSGDSATGANGNEWLVVVPVAFPACATHPTGTMSLTVPGLCGPILNQTNTAIKDSGVSQSDSGGHPSHLWGIDLGGTHATLMQLCGTPAIQLTYSGDSLYTGF